MPLGWITEKLGPNLRSQLHMLDTLELREQNLTAP